MRRIVRFLICVWVVLGLWVTAARASGVGTLAVPRLTYGPTLVSGRVGLGGDLSVTFLPERFLVRQGNIFSDAEEVSWMPRLLFSGWMGTGGDRGAFVGLGGVFRLERLEALALLDGMNRPGADSGVYSRVATVEVLPGLRHLKLDGDSRTGLGLRVGVRFGRRMPLSLSLEVGPGAPMWGIGFSWSF